MARVRLLREIAISMTNLRLYGKTDRCWWCAQKIPHNQRKVQFAWGKEDYDLLVCSPGCEDAVLKAMRYVRKTGPIFLVGVLGGIVLIAIPRFGTEMVGLMLMGVTLLVCPFCTPQTTKMLGMKKSFTVGRTIGSLVLLGATSVLLYSLLR